MNRRLSSHSDSRPRGSVIWYNGIGLATVKSDHEAKRLCQVAAGQTLQLDMRRAGTPVELSVVAETRPGL